LTKKTHIATLSLAAAVLAGCAAEQEQSPRTDQPVVADLTFAITTGSHDATRQSAAVVQETGQPFRGLSDVRLIPFAVRGKIGSGDRPLTTTVTGSGERPVLARTYYYWDHCPLMNGVASFLCYGHAPVASSKAENGTIAATFPLNMMPGDIRFTLESIAERKVYATAAAIAGYMTAIATATAGGTTWQDTPNTALQSIYMNFVNRTASSNPAGELLPGSATTVHAHTLELRSRLAALTLPDPADDALRTAIIAQIDTWNDEWNDFPATIGLPDGAMAVRWTGTAFEAQVGTTSVADINGIDRFAYPAEVYYYANSRINTSTQDDRKAYYTDTEWANVLNHFENSDGVVNGGTKAVAIQEPLQYAVAHLQLKLLHTDATTLRDAEGTEIPVGTANFPLTGILVGGQLPVGFDFRPATVSPTYSELDAKVVYDSQVKTAAGSYLCLRSDRDATETVNTLLLQSYDHKSVPVVLEFENRSGMDFTCLTGTVYNDTKFYLVGEVDPETHKDDSRVDIRDRVFTQDYTTIIQMKVASLEKAYNVVPNLLAPRLELGVEVITEWIQATPDEILL